MDETVKTSKSNSDCFGRKKSKEVVEVTNSLGKFKTTTVTETPRKGDTKITVTEEVTRNGETTKEVTVMEQPRAVQAMSVEGAEGAESEGGNVRGRTGLFCDLCCCGCSIGNPTSAYLCCFGFSIGRPCGVQCRIPIYC